MIPPGHGVATGVGRHRRPEPFHPRHRAPAPSRRPPARRRSAVMLALGLLAAATVSGGTSPAEPDRGAAAVALSAEASVASARLMERTEAAGVASRGSPREAAPPVAVEAAPVASAVAPAPPQALPPPEPRAVAADTKPKPQPKPEPKPEPAPRPAPVGGLNQQQMDHAAVIVAMGQRAGLPQRAHVVAIATALQESYLRNLANPVYPESLNLSHEGVGYDHDSVGLFQQRPSTGWGSVSQIMDPAYSATKFYEALARVSGWQDLPITVAAQRVQVSAFPDHYAKHEPLARQIVDALT